MHLARRRRRRLTPRGPFLSPHSSLPRSRRQRHELHLRAPHPGRPHGQVLLAAHRGGPGGHPAPGARAALELELDGEGSLCFVGGGRRRAHACSRGSLCSATRQPGQPSARTRASTLMPCTVPYRRCTATTGCPRTTCSPCCAPSPTSRSTSSAPCGAPWLAARFEPALSLLPLRCCAGLPSFALLHRCTAAAHCSPRALASSTLHAGPPSTTTRFGSGSNTMWSRGTSRVRAALAPSCYCRHTALLAQSGCRLPDGCPTDPPLLLRSSTNRRGQREHEGAGAAPRQAGGAAQV